MKPVVDRLSAEYAESVEFRLVNLDTGGSDAAQLADRFGIQYVPTFVFVDETGEIVEQHVGGMEESLLREKLDGLAP
jgi:cytochrome c-type biogenesis protein